jgi:ketosteroid isomerase-like protein
MSEQNVEVIRRAFEAIAAGDADSLAGLASEDAELRSVVSGIEGRVYRGPQGIRQYSADLIEAFERVDQTAEELIDLDENGVLVIIRVEARSRTSGLELAQRFAVHWTFKEGKPWRGVGYADMDEARRAVGLT